MAEVTSEADAKAAAAIAAVHRARASLLPLKSETRHLALWCAQKWEDLSELIPLAGLDGPAAGPEFVGHFSLTAGESL
jgi:hypothetical protein